WIAGFSRQYGVPAAQSAILPERYGNAAHRIAKAAGAAISESLASLPDYSRGEIEALIRDEQVVTLADILFRRTSIAIAGRLSFVAVHEIAQIAARALDWPADVRAREIEATLALARDRHGVRLGANEDRKWATS